MPSRFAASKPGDNPVHSAVLADDSLTGTFSPRTPIADTVNLPVNLSVVSRFPRVSPPWFLGQRPCKWDIFLACEESLRHPPSIHRQVLREKKARAPRGQRAFTGDSRGTPQPFYGELKPGGDADTTLIRCSEDSSEPLRFPRRRRADRISCLSGLGEWDIFLPAPTCWPS